MKVVSTNLGERRTVMWRGQQVDTGIFKEPVNHPIVLGKKDVEGDHVVDRRYHGGVDKACYLYSADHYSYWQDQYPEMNMAYGTFGENLTIEGLDERQMVVGSTYRLGEALVQVSEPRQPCFKLGIRFEDQGIIKNFIQTTYSGVYLRVLESGEVKVGDELKIEKQVEEGLSIADVFQLIYSKSPIKALVGRLVNNNFLPDRLKVKLVGKHGVN